MLLNALWRVHEDLRIHNLDDRTITIDTSDGVYGDAGVWGRIVDFSHAEASEPCIIREASNDQVILTAITDKPLKVEIWDTINDLSFSLDWDGHGWCRGTELDADDESISEWIFVSVVDVETLAHSVCLDLGLNYLDPSLLRSGNYQIELLERENFSMLSIYDRHILYHSLDDAAFQYTTDHALIPPVSELNAIFCPEEGKTDNTIFILYDEEDGPMATLFRILKRKDLTVTTYENPSEDIVDMKWTAAKAIENDSLVSHLYLIYHDSEYGRKYRLFVNMEQFQPKYAPYLSTNH